ncbi:MAG: YraN family protein [Spirochaetia bacterium]|jgi:putative endonuclease
MKRKEKGTIGENKAVEKLLQDGYTVLSKNYRSKYGEIDIIAVKNSTIAFIEVKVSDYLEKENLEYIINAKKKQHIIKTAKYYLMNNMHYVENHKRFDVILFQDNFEKMHHIMNAF